MQGASWPNRHTEEPSQVADWLLQHVSTAASVGTNDDLISAVMGNPEWLDTRKLQPYQCNRFYYHRTQKSAVNVAVCDSSWEVRLAELLDFHPKITRWIRNERLGWTIPYRHDGMSRNYEPDFVAVAQLANGHELRIVMEVKGLERVTDLHKRRWTEEFWLPAVNSHPQFGAHGPWTYLYLDEAPNELYTPNDISDLVASFQ